MDVHATKEQIMYAAITLFSDLGYEAVSMRYIAAKVGIKAASIYNHYASKEDILDTIYDYYARNQDGIMPALDDLLRMLETEPVEKVFEALNFHHQPEIQENMDRIVIIASRRLFGNKNESSEKFIRKYVFERIHREAVAFVTRMIELGKIEVVDVELFASILANYTFGAAALGHSSMKTSPQQWQKAITMLFSLLQKK